MGMSNLDGFHPNMNESYRLGYRQGRADKYQEIVSEYMLLTEKQVDDIMAEERENIVEIINKAEDKLVGCYKNPKDIMTIRMAFAELREDIDNSK